MKNLTSLPVLFSTLLLWSLSGALGCGGNSGAGTGGGGTGGTGGTETGGGGTGGDTGGTTTGGTTTGGTGGTSTGGTGGTGGSELPACEGRPPKVLACLQSSMFAGDPSIPINLDTTGIVTAVRAPNAGEVCGDNFWYRVGYAETPDVMIDLDLAGEKQLTIGLKMPGLPEAKVAVGDTLAVKYSADVVGFGGRLALLEVRHEDALVAAVGENMPAGPAPTEGAAACYSEDSLCGWEERVMEVAAPDGSTISIDGGETVDVGGLMVTNDRFIHHYDVSGGCNFGLSVEYLMSAAAP